MTTSKVLKESAKFLYKDKTNGYGCCNAIAQVIHHHHHILPTFHYSYITTKKIFTKYLSPNLNPSSDYWWSNPRTKAGKANKEARILALLLASEIAKDE